MHSVKAKESSGIFKVYMKQTVATAREHKTVTGQILSAREKRRWTG